MKDLYGFGMFISFYKVTNELDIIVKAYLNSM